MYDYVWLWLIMSDDGWLCMIMDEYAYMYFK